MPKQIKQQSNNFQKIARYLITQAALVKMQAGKANLFTQKENQKIAETILKTERIKVLKKAQNNKDIILILRALLKRQGIKLIVQKSAMDKIKQLRDFYLKNKSKLKNIKILMLTNISVFEDGVLSLDKEQNLEEWTKEEWTKMV